MNVTERTAAIADMPTAGTEYADAHAHMVGWLTADQRAAYDRAMADLDARVAATVAEHWCGMPGDPVDVARCGDCWDAEDEAYALRHASQH